MCRGCVYWRERERERKPMNVRYISWKHRISDIELCEEKFYFPSVWMCVDVSGCIPSEPHHKMPGGSQRLSSRMTRLGATRLNTTTRLTGYTRRAFFGLQPPCGTAVLSVILRICKPLATMDRKAGSLPLPNPLRWTTTWRSPRCCANSAIRDAVRVPASSEPRLCPRNEHIPPVTVRTNRWRQSLSVTCVLFAAASTWITPTPSGNFGRCSWASMEPF